ncbi:hypothetical protein ATK36_0385 [Amycolatopsis sulphurea]|uniref:Uncharacterized protein n=1 Tax=Amycolatopsis sulphurea TaxID=76022 RepID=A0A2A9G112_9PSEU|nr:hypothetical protein [Amycolatopsis sulphurea]PFG56853.1 hypothetical protein ATK36_0385 [Amycolatopsis sulphurea]
MTNTALDDAGRCLLSVAWNIRTGGPRSDPYADATRTRLRTLCRTLGHATCRHAETGAPGDHVPALRLADLAYEIDILLMLVGTSLVPSPRRDHRRRQEIDALLAGLDTLAAEAAAALDEVCVPG